MRKWAYLEKPYICNKKDMVYKIMIYQTTGEGVYVFLYTSKEAIQSSFDFWYDELADALEDWENQADEMGWQEIDDPPPGCQRDAFLPIRVKGRDAGNPVWGELEILKDGQWVEYHST